VDLVDRLARTRIGSTHNQYARSPLRPGLVRTHVIVVPDENRNEKQNGSG